MGDPAGRPRRTGRRDAPGQGGPGVGARALPGAERIRHARRAGGARPADDAGGNRHLPELAAQPRPGGRRARLLRAPAVGLEGLGRPVTHDGARPAHLRPGLRLVACPIARPVGRPPGDRRLPRQGPQLRPGDRPVLLPLRRSERARPPAAEGSRRCRGERGHRGDLTAVRRAGRESAFPAQPARRSGQPTRISFLLTNSSAPYLPSSRPEPERLTPPNGSSAPSAPTMLTYTIPASISFATRSACSASVVKR